MAKKIFVILLFVISLCFPAIMFSETVDKDVGQYIEEGMKYGDSGKFNEAIESFNKVITLDPKNPKAYMMIGMAYLQLSQIDKAIENLRKSIELNPGN